MRIPLFPLIVSVLISAFFFFQIFSGKIPFPGDLLVGNYEPYKSLSYGGFAPGAVPNKAQGPDVIKELLPWKKFTIDSFKKMELPLWDPYNFSGNPMMANFQSGVFYPGNLVFFLLSFENAWTLYIFLAPVLSILFTYLFLRRLKLAFWPSIFGGVSFAFCLYMTVWIEYGNIGHTFVFLPLILYFADKLIEKTDKISFLGIVVAGFCAALAGYIQGLFYIYAIVFVYFLIKSNSLKKLNFRKTFVFISTLIFPIILSAFQILPTLELFGNSTRGNYTFSQIEKMLNPIYYLITVVAPDFFGNPAARNYWFNGTYIERASYFGLIPLIFAILAIVSIKKVEVKIFTILFLFSLLISTDLFVTRFFYLIPIPVLSTTVATRILSILSFSGAILAAFGFDYVLENKNKKKIFMISLSLLAILGGAFLLSIIYPKTTTNISLIAEANIAKRNLIVPLTTLIVFIGSTMIFVSRFEIFKRHHKNFYIFAVLAITILELFYYFQKITPFAPKSYLYPQAPVVDFIKNNAGINRYWGYGFAYIESNFQTFDQTFSTEGNDPLHIKNYTEILAASKTGRLPEILPRPDANIAGGFGSEDLSENIYRRKILNITGVKYVLNKDEGIKEEANPDNVTFPPDRYKLAWQNGFWQAYENLDMTPRFFLTNEYVVVPNKSRALETIFASDFDEKKKLILYEDPKVSGGQLLQSTNLISYSQNRVEIHSSSSGPALLYLSDNYYPGWQASIDGKNSKIYLADYSFRAVAVPAGPHKIVFSFHPKKFYYGLYISAVALLGLLVYLFKFNFKNEK